MTHPAATPRIGLAMIVRNEAPVIARCLRSVAGLIDCWTIVDTGSSDGTQQIIREVMAELGIPGQLHERPWRDFGSNRSESLALARPLADYSFVIDADEQLLTTHALPKVALTHPVYMLEVLHGNLRYFRQCLFSNRLPWRYVGVLHEHPDAGEPVRPILIDSLRVSTGSGREGARSRNPRKYHDDAELLLRALEQEPDNLRYHYYLGQSWRDAKEHQRAHDAYGHRASLGGWAEEAWHARYQQANMKVLLRHPPAEIAEAYLSVWELCPTRLEPLIWLAAYWRGREQWQRIVLLLDGLPPSATPVSGLFVEAPCHGWRRHDELAIACFNLGRLTDAAEQWQQALALQDADATQTERMRKGLAACEAG
ncbi:MAG: glycosyltransferase [Pseudomonadota bacterium]